jgi:hypothetical protein
MSQSIELIDSDTAEKSIADSHSNTSRKYRDTPESQVSEASKFSWVVM